MFAVIRSGGKQYKVQPGDVIRVEKLEQALGSEFDVTDILMVGGEQTVIGQPTVTDAKVTVVVTKQTKDRKVIIFKKKRRQGYRRFKTHRQPFTELFVKAISLKGKVAKSDETANVVDVDAKREEHRQAKQADKQAARESRGEAAQAAAPKAAKKKVAKKAAGKKKVAKKSGKAAGKKKAAKKKR